MTADQITTLIIAIFFKDWPVWPKGQKLEFAQQPFGIGKVLIDAFHRHLAGIEIVWVWREKLVRLGEPLYGKASLANPLLHFLTGAVFVIEMSYEVWPTMTPLQQIAAVDHELMHLEIEGEKPSIRAHDIEEFGEILRRWGAWHSTITILASQLELFEQAAKLPTGVPDDEPAHAAG